MRVFLALGLVLLPLSAALADDPARPTTPPRTQAAYAESTITRIPVYSLRREPIVIPYDASSADDTKPTVTLWDLDN